MSQGLGRDVPDLETFMQESFGLIFRSLAMVIDVNKNPENPAVRIPRYEFFTWPFLDNKAQD